MSDIERDPDYDFVPPPSKPVKRTKGKQCGKCGAKFDYGQAYGFCCPHNDCPAGWGPYS